MIGSSIVCRWIRTVCTSSVVQSESAVDRPTGELSDTATSEKPIESTNLEAGSHGSSSFDLGMDNQSERPDSVYMTASIMIKVLRVVTFSLYR